MVVDGGHTMVSIWLPCEQWRFVAVAVENCTGTAEGSGD